MRSIFADVPDVSDGLKKFQLKLVSAAAEKIGWDFPEGESLLTGQLRALLIAQAGLAGHQRYVSFLLTSGNQSAAVFLFAYVSTDGC